MTISVVDKFVGHKLRARRIIMGLSQAYVADKLGLVFQQIQKYEKGTNRIGASRLYNLALILEVKINYFFDGLYDENYSCKQVDDALPKETIECINAFKKIKSKTVKNNILVFIKSLNNY